MSGEGDITVPYHQQAKMVWHSVFASFDIRSLASAGQGDVHTTVHKHVIHSWLPSI